MKSILKLLLISLLIPLVFSSCRDEDYSITDSPEPSFKLYDTSLGSNVLYPSMENNTFRLVWDESMGSTKNYTVMLSAAEDFKTPITFGTTSEQTFASTVGHLNDVLLQAGYSPYGVKRVYFRIEVPGTDGTRLVSNVISFDVTPYPVDKPVITNPKSGETLTLDAQNPTGVATTVSWVDYMYGISANYTVELAMHGSSEFISAGTVVNEKELTWTNFDLNDVVLKLGLPVGVSSKVDVRVSAATTSAGGTIIKTSDIVTFNIIPYQPAYLPFYLVGGGTAVGWDASKAQLLYQQENISEIYTYLENGGLFRFLGQQDWNPLNYSLNADGIKENYRYFNTWSDNLTVDGDENIKFTGNSGMYKITIDQNARAISVTPSSITTLPTNVYIVGSLNDWSAENALPMEQIGDGLFEYTIAIPDGAQFKFIGQKAWGDLEWGNIHRAGNSGFVGPKGDNDNIQYNGGGAVYKITLNVKLGTYKVTPQ